MIYENPIKNQKYFKSELRSQLFLLIKIFEIGLFQKSTQSSKRIVEKD
jgi:hypothetical protein